jgi:hypothetical protein
MLAEKNKKKNCDEEGAEASALWASRVRATATPAVLVVQLHRRHHFVLVANCQGKGRCA